jgi:hypothetical protein
MAESQYAYGVDKAERGESIEISDFGKLYLGEVAGPEDR